ncbi:MULTISPECIES: hypothetical protein [Pseudoalteromonas]|uniref:Uncharacterized protein n=1 Tax=Pseudoalteromonas fuliginea TaxID=1872678 RepID=A0A063KDP0_9GAMM|nr:MULTISPECIES: hypothetical protein [Pseudoalteromonas]ALQ09640.1 hypothetical protein D172_017170 [Pseudoalteromonas sp. Bsw20308]ATG76104.1 hypothetical protein AOR04_00260 [Pseudoalteromonas sp. 1_2015MBL_MicDiv]KAA1162625.1 hypothetical protein EU509_04055 [Pseudoalteromonas fuliginea]KAA1164258.1 hypothetical protein EU508_02855 [Pseudoalteromonas fuliginea]KAA1168557.1 hypothetical protein EUZ79_04555 [Pseudoalteromonas fuliginea]
MHTPSYTAVDAAVAIIEKTTDDHSYAVDMRATVIDLLSHPKHNQKAITKHETDQIFILGYN